MAADRHPEPGPWQGGLPPVPGGESSGPAPAGVSRRPRPGSTAGRPCLCRCRRPADDPGPRVPCWGSSSSADRTSHAAKGAGEPRVDPGSAEGGLRQGEQKGAGAQPQPASLGDGCAHCPGTASGTGARPDTLVAWEQESRAGLPPQAPHPSPAPTHVDSTIPSHRPLPPR